MSQFGRLWSEFQIEVRSNARLRTGIWSILLILLFYLVLVQAERVSDEISAYNVQSVRLEKVLRLQDQEDLWRLLELEKQAAARLQEYLWNADTLGVAQASLQQSINSILANMKVRNPRIRFGIAQPLEGAQGVWQVQAQIDAHYSRGDEVKLLHDLATHPKKLIVDRLELDSRGRRLLVQVSAYFKGLDSR